MCKYTNNVTARTHAWVADEPQGADAGPAPYELLLSALGACTSITLRMYAERKGWELGTISVALRFIRESKEDTGRIERDVNVSGVLDADQLKRLGEIVENTPVTKTLKAGTPIATRFPDQESQIDRSEEESFPASDPPAHHKA
jgi:putative redox protein